MEMLLCVETTTTPAGVVVVVATGEVDFSTAGLLGERVREAHDVPAAPRALVVDLSGVEFLSAAGVGVLVVEHHRSRSRGVPLLVVAPNRSVRRTLAACDALSVLQVVADSPVSSAARLGEAPAARADGDLPTTRCFGELRPTDTAAPDHGAPAKPVRSDVTDGGPPESRARQA
ncbi:MAG TPA: STAS domain-containing protein [Umezawaea sp.]|nr:STAS domain-containing protein [Umezawaea sp.]